MTILGLSLALFFHVCTYPWPFYPGKLDYKVISELNDSLVILEDGTNGDEDDLGCDPHKYSWCNHTREVNFW